MPSAPESHTPNEATAIDARLQERIPLMRPEWLPNYLRMIEHDAAPRWNTRCGDRLEAEDLARIESFAGELRDFHTTKTNANANASDAANQHTPPDRILRWLARQAGDSLAIQERLRDAAAIVRDSDSDGGGDPEQKPGELDLARDFLLLKSMTRADLAAHLDRIVPQSIDLERLVVNPTSGTTGQPIPAPNHPAAVGCYDPLIQTALRLNGVEPDYARSDRTAAVQICAQRRTITYATVHSALKGAGFAKINLAASEWRGAGDARQYVADLAPFFLSGDPHSFAAFLRYLNDLRDASSDGLFGASDYRPRALISTALQLSAGLREQFEAAFACPVIDLYSLNECGPVACSVPETPGRMLQLAPDIFIEALEIDRDVPVADGTPGEIAITGGRNPYLPLVRYRTGDTGCVFRRQNGRTELVLNHAREMVLFEYAGDAAAMGRDAIVNPIDVARILRRFPIIQFQFTQFANRACLLSLQIAGSPPLRHESQIRDQLVELFGFTEAASLRVQYTDDWSDARFSPRGAGDGQRKVRPFRRIESSPPPSRGAAE